VVVAEPLMDALETDKGHAPTVTSPLRMRFSTAFTARISGSVTTR
jgi:hypothetical protein